MAALKIDPFLLALIAAVALAAVLPATGAAAGVVDSAADLLIALLFFLYGARLSTAAVRAGLGKWRLQLAILAATFVAYPLLAFGLSRLASPWLPPALVAGVAFLGCLPSTVQSSVGFTAIARGDVAAALCAAAASNLLGVALTPLLVALLLQAQSGGLRLDAVLAVLTQLLLPFLLGQVARRWIGGWAERRRGLLSLFDRAVIVLIVYAAFSAAVAAGLWRTLDPADLLLLVALCGVLYAVAVALLFGLARALRLPSAEAAVLIFCGSHKSLVAGAPLAAALFPAALAGPVLLPVMIFHQLQLLASAVIARRQAAGQVRSEPA